MRKKAVAALIEKDNKILAVSRKDNPNDFGLPGGKIDPGEQPLSALCRELQEETGLSVINAEKVFQMPDGEYDTICYRVQTSGEIYTQEAGIVSWVDWDTICSGTFATYNRALFAAIYLKVI